MRRVTSLVACSAMAAVALVTLSTSADAKVTPPKAAAASIKTSPYVALGDSYSSGAGVAPFVDGSPGTCSRSTRNFAEDIAAVTHPASFTDATCSGAKTKDLYTSQAPGVPPQLDAVTKRTRLVTMTLSGNDGNVFANSFFGCAKLDLQAGPTGSPCKDKYGDTFIQQVENETYPALVQALDAVRAKAPRATIVILGYPRILPDKGSLSCYRLMGISIGDVPWLVHQAEVANEVVRRAAAAAGARFVDTYTASTGHDACSGPDTRWMEPLFGPVDAYPVHPNATGEAMMAKETLAAIGR